MKYSIETRSITKKFPVLKRYRDIFLQPFSQKKITALQDVTLQVPKGELFGLIGPNGAGKTTLIKILCTLILPTSGRAFVNGIDVTKKDMEVRKTIGYVLSDQRSFYWRLTGEQNLRFFATLNNIFGKEADRKIWELLEYMDLVSDARRLFKDYSTGMRQKLAIVRGLLTDPEIIFMDEPFNGLDPLSTRNLKTLIKEKLVQGHGKTVVLTTHNLQDAEELCTSLAVINRGEIKFTGKLKDIKQGFNKNKTYILKLKSPERDLACRLQNIPMIKKIAQTPDDCSNSNIDYEVEIAGSNGNVSGIIKRIIETGGELYSLSEKEPSLEEVFSRIIDTE